ncbi:RagB/SusD family nutrient uptake outer membrane protein [Compostibacter hankyongensis]
MKKPLITGIFILIIISALSSCKQFLDVVPDNVATLDNAFATRNEAQKFLFTCYSYMPNDGDLADDPALVGGDELWRFATEGAYFNIAQGYQNVVSPYGDRWGTYFQGIRDCNIFLDNVDRVPDLMETEKRRWVSEVKFLKAYYNFYLVKMYGPIPIMKENLPVNVKADEVRVSRAPVDSCFEYIITLVNEAMGDLPQTIDDPTNELGRITRTIALAFKAEVLVYAASPLFNGNTDEARLKNPDGTQLFNQTFSKEKWDSAAVACREAIEACEQLGLKLYKYQPAFQQFDLSDTIMTQLSIRNAICERWNSEIVWANTQTSTVSLQALITPRMNPKNLDMTAVHGQLSPPLKIAEQFYSDHGVPIAEDRTWGYAERYDLQTAGDSDKLYVRKDYTTAHMNFNREPRFYADMGFDGGIWYGQGMYDDKKNLDLYYLEAKYRQRNGYGKPGFSTITGYFLKKQVHYQNVLANTGNTYSVTDYPWPIMRLADLYLLYAEALNEAEGPGPEVLKYVDLVRERAGLQTVQDSWTQYSNNPTKFATQNGMREIIQQERLIELAFEGKRFWDLRRWKKAVDEMNRPIQGWDLLQELPSAYYRPTMIFQQTFSLKDYFFPIKESTITNNRNLVQNLGW